MVGGLVSGYLLLFLVLGGLGLLCFCLLCFLGFGEEGELGVCCVGEGE